MKKGVTYVAMESVVIIPAYNNAFQVQECIKSLEKQIYKDFSVIVVDDGSDPCLSTEMFLTSNISVNLYRKVNEGAGKARNYALSKVSSNTKYVFFIDSDDLIEANYLLTITQMMNSNRLDFCQCSYIINNRVKYPLPNKLIITEDKKIIDSFILEMFGSYPDRKDVQKWSTALWACGFRMDIIRKNNLQIFSERDYMSEDTLFKIDYLKKCKKIGLSPYAGYHYIASSSSLTHRVYSNQLEVLKNFYNALETRLWPIITEDAMQRVYRKLLMYYTNTILSYAVSNNLNKLQSIRCVLHDDVFIKCARSIKIYKLNIKNIVFLMLGKFKAAYILMKVGELFGK